MMDINIRYGLEFNPFAKNSKQIIFVSKEFKEARFRLDNLATTKGFGLLTGSPGNGKTSTAKEWVDSLNPSLFKKIYTSFATLTVNEFFSDMALNLGCQPAYRKSENFHLIQDAVNRLAIEKRKTPVIIIDEIDKVPSKVLHDLTLLFNFEMDSRDRAVVLLVGQPRIIDTLNLNAHEPLRQRIIMNYTLDGLSKEEGRRYIATKLEGAGCHQTVFDDAAVEAMLNAADGTPRMINKYCNSALIIGNSHDQPVITAETALQAINECTL